MDATQDGHTVTADALPHAARHHCTVRTPDGGTIETTVADGSTLLSPFVGRPDGAIAVGCRGGGCGVCRVQVIEGDYHCKRMSRRFVTEDEERDGYALACRLIVTDDVVVRTCPEAR